MVKIISQWEKLNGPAEEKENIPCTVESFKHKQKICARVAKHAGK